MSNQKILQALQNSEYSENAKTFTSQIGKWDKSETFPYKDLKQYLKLHQWEYNDFNFENELLIQEFLPAFVLDIFFAMKEFRDNSRMELTSVQETYARIYGYPHKTQDEKAFCLYEYLFNRYYENSEIKGE